MDARTPAPRGMGLGAAPPGGARFGQHAGEGLTPGSDPAAAHGVPASRGVRAEPVSQRLAGPPAAGIAAGLPERCRSATLIREEGVRTAEAANELAEEWWLQSAYRASR